MGTPAPLIRVEELAAADPRQTLVVDCRFTLSDPARGHRDYLEGHLPGAVHASLDDDLSDLGQNAGGLGRHPLPDASGFARSLGRWGWHDGLTVVACDAGNGAMAAARLWWLMRWAGAAARVLDGGLAAWTTAGLPLEAEAVERVPTRPEVHFDAGQVLFTAALREQLDADRILLLDARAAPRYRGENEPIDPRAGHVPGARNRPFTDNLDAGGRWKTPEVLRREFRGIIGERDPAAVVHMCGSGVTACHNLLAMEHAGLHGSRLYAPSWSGWSSEADRPVATGDG